MMMRSLHSPLPPELFRVVDYRRGIKHPLARRVSALLKYAQPNPQATADAVLSG